MGCGKIDLHGALGRVREFAEGANGRHLVRCHLVQERLVDPVRAATALGGVGDLVGLSVGLELGRSASLE